MKRSYLIVWMILVISGFLSCTNNTRNKAENKGFTTDSGIQNNQTTDTGKIDTTSTKGAVKNDTVHFGQSQ